MRPHRLIFLCAERAQAFQSLGKDVLQQLLAVVQTFFAHLQHHCRHAFVFEALDFAFGMLFDARGFVFRVFDGAGDNPFAFRARPGNQLFAFGFAIFFDFSDNGRQ